jgi:hypothetical protein
MLSGKALWPDLSREQLSYLLERLPIYEDPPSEAVNSLILVLQCCLSQPLKLEDSQHSPQDAVQKPITRSSTRGDRQPQNLEDDSGGPINR